MKLWAKAIWINARPVVKDVVQFLLLFVVFGGIIFLGLFVIMFLISFAVWVLSLVLPVETVLLVVGGLLVLAGSFLLIKYIFVVVRGACQKIKKTKEELERE